MNKSGKKSVKSKKGACESRGMCTVTNILCYDEFRSYHYRLLYCLREKRSEQCVVFEMSHNIENKLDLLRTFIT